MPGQRRAGAIPRVVEALRGLTAAAAARKEGTLLDSDSSCGLTVATDRPGVAPVLGPLANNGGPTQTHALFRSSPAVDRIPVGASGCGIDFDDDQRGACRPRDGDGTLACDSGAFELGIVIRITIDIRPLGVLDIINPDSRLFLPVAVLTTKEVDASDIDPTSVAFGPDRAPVAFGKGQLVDVDGDGDRDLLLLFWIP